MSDRYKRVGGSNEALLDAQMLAPDSHAQKEMKGARLLLAYRQILPVRDHFQNVIASIAVHKLHGSLILHD